MVTVLKANACPNLEGPVEVIRKAGVVEEVTWDMSVMVARFCEQITRLPECNNELQGSSKNFYYTRC